MSNLAFPLNPNDVAVFYKNFGCPTDYGDFTHDGVDMDVRADKEVPILAVDGGRVILQNWVNDDVGMEVHLYLGSDKNGQRIIAVYVHMDRAVPNNTVVKRGDVIGWIAQAHAGGKHLHFEVRVGTKPRYQSPSDGTPGDEVDVTNILQAFIPESKTGYPADCPAGASK